MATEPILQDSSPGRDFAQQSTAPTCAICGKHAAARMEVKAGVVVGCACCYRAYNSLTVRESLQEPRIPVLRLDEADGWAEDWRDFATRLARVEAGR